MQSSACTLTSVVSRRFRSLLQVLETRQASTLSDIEVAKKQALGHVLDEKQRLTEHLKALSQYDRSVQDLLGQADDSIFFQVPDIRASGEGLASRPGPPLTVSVPGIRNYSSSPSPWSRSGHCLLHGGMKSSS